MLFHLVNEGLAWHKLAVKLVNAEDVRLKIIQIEAKILNTNQQKVKENKVLIVRKIYVAKNVQLRKCIKDVFVNYQKIDVVIDYPVKAVNFAPVWDVTLKRNLMDHLLALREISPNKVRIITLFLMKQNWTLITSIVQLSGV